MSRKKMSKEEQKDFLESDDISTCPICGNTNMWIGMDDDGCAKSINCTRCGWICGDTNRMITMSLRIDEVKYKIKRRLEKWTRHIRR